MNPTLTMLRNLLSAMSLRERVLLAAFLWLCIAVWVGTASRSFRETKIAFTKVTTEMETQSLWLEKREETETRLNKALDLVDPRGRHMPALSSLENSIPSRAIRT